MRSSNLANHAVPLPSITQVHFKEEMMEVSLSNGRILSVPVAWYPCLANAKKSERDHLEISPRGYGIHWPELDEDLSVKGFLFP